MLVIDLDGVLLNVSAVVRGRTSRVIFHVGAPVKTTRSDRVGGKRSTVIPTPGKAVTMDLQADKKVSLSLQATDEMGNLTVMPAGATAVFTVDNAAVINLTDHGDGTAVAAATGVLGTATVHVDVATLDLHLTGDLAIVVVPGLAERIAVVAGAPEEVTPDA